MKRLQRSAKQAYSKTGIYLGLFTAIVTIVGIIGYEIITDNLIYRIVIVALIFIVAYVVALLTCYFCSVSVQLGNGRTLVIEYDSLFSKQGIIVIPFNCFFDTLVNEDILSEKAVAGQFIKNCFAVNLSELDRQMSLSLKSINSIQRIGKSGKDLAYPIGTVVKVQKNANYYFCVAQTDVDENLKSVCDIEMLHKTIIEILKFIDQEANGRDVYMPLLGAGFSRLNKEKQIILDYLISILKITDIPIQSTIHIVLREVERESIDLAKYL